MPTLTSLLTATLILRSETEQQSRKKTKKTKQDEVQRGTRGHGQTFRPLSPEANDFFLIESLFSSFL